MPNEVWDLKIKLNRPDEEDDPENRYDCDFCMDAPAATENIVLIVDKLTGDVVEKFCISCTIQTLRGD